MTEQSNIEWFDRPDPDTGEVGLRFSCTCCGNCCSGGPGVVLVTDDEIAALAKRLGEPVGEFVEQRTHQTSRGRSLNERMSPFGLDCIFLDRESVPGKAVCGVYEDRPAQCRAWPFWNELTRSRRNWVKASGDCPGMNTGRLYAPEEIRIIRRSDPL